MGLIDRRICIAEIRRRGIRISFVQAAAKRIADTDCWPGPSGREYRCQYHESTCRNLRLDCRDSFHHKSLALAFLENSLPHVEAVLFEWYNPVAFCNFRKEFPCPVIQNGPPSNARK